jgi:hypothetical protein
LTSPGHNSNTAFRLQFGNIFEKLTGKISKDIVFLPRKVYTVGNTAFFIFLARERAYMHGVAQIILSLDRNSSVRVAQIPILFLSVAWGARPDGLREQAKPYCIRPGG